MTYCSGSGCNHSATQLPVARWPDAGFPDLTRYTWPPHGPLAQMGERRLCTAEVRGSTPLRSTTAFTLKSRAFVRVETGCGPAEMASGKHSANERVVTPGDSLARVDTGRHGEADGAAPRKASSRHSRHL